MQENLTDNESDQEKNYSDNNISKNEDSDENISEHEDSDGNQSEHYIENYYSQDGIPYECTKEEIKIINYNITQLIDISCKLKYYF